MKQLLLAALPAIILLGCASPAAPPVITQPSPVAVVGQDLNSAAERVLTDYATYKNGGKDMLWALQEAFYAYQDLAKIPADVKEIVSVWTGSKGQPLADRIELLFKTSNGRPAEKMKALAAAATSVAAK